MPLIKGNAVVADDWALVGDEEPLPADGRGIVSLARWCALRDGGRDAAVPKGVLLRPDDDPESIADALDSLAVVALDFPAMTDGRPLSTARLLRERYGFAGEVRAVGAVRRDALAFMRRCGIDAYAVDGTEPVESCLAALRELRRAYQRAADELRPLAVVRIEAG